MRVTFSPLALQFRVAPTSCLTLQDTVLAAVTLEAEPRSVFDDLPDGVMVMTMTGRVELANSAILAMLGRERRDVVGRPLEGIVAAEDMLQILGVEHMFAPVLPRATESGVF